MAMTTTDRQRLFRARKAGFDSYEEYQNARAADKAGRESTDARYKESARQNENQRERGEEAEREGWGLLSPCKTINGDPIRELHQEKNNIIFWSKLLNVELPKGDESVCLTEMCRRVYDAHKSKNNFAMYNPFTKRFSPSWYVDPAGRTFATAWELMAGSDTMMLIAEDWEAPKIEIESEIQEAECSIASAQTEVKQLEEKISSNPIAIFKSEIIEN